MTDADNCYAERARRHREAADALRDTDGVAVVDHIPGPESPSGHLETDAVVRADRYGGVPPGVPAAVADHGLSLVRIETYQHPDYCLLVVR
jgi:hypothetical protein